MLRGRTRVPSACQRCRKQKIKCSGTRPCRTCSGRGYRCEFGAEDKQVAISEKELFALRSRLSQLERLKETSDPPAHPERSGTRDSNEDNIDEIGQLEDSAHQVSGDARFNSRRRSTSPRSINSLNDLEQINFTNPLVPEQPAYVAEPSGKLRYLGHSSGYAFTQQVLHMLHQNPPSNPSPEILLSLSGRAHQVDTNRLVPLSMPNVSKLPSKSTALHYLQCLKFRTVPLIYLFDEPDFTAQLQQFYKDPAEYAQSSMIWYAHYLVLMAFGKALDPHAQHLTPSNSSISEHFTRALQMLPDISYLCDYPIEATEVLCSIALYLQAIDHRCAALVYIGQAIRLAQIHALHLNLQESIVGTRAVERGHRIWWTVYALNQKLTSNLGLPNFLNEKDITSPLPIVSENDEDTTALAIHVKICQLLGLLISRVYSSSHEFRESFVATTRKVLKGAVKVANDLRQYSERCFGDISRVAAHLELAYHQCVILACRPVLFYLLKLRNEGWRDSETFTLPQSMTGLVQVCVDSATQAVQTLFQLQEHNLLDTFLPFDLESAFSAAFILVMADRVHPKVPVQPQSIHHAVSVIITIADRGNSAAKLRRLEINQLQELLSQQVNTSLNLDAAAQSQSAGSMSMAPQLESSESFGFPYLGTPFFADFSVDVGLSGDQIMDLADALDVEDFDNFNPMTR